MRRFLLIMLTGICWAALIACADAEADSEPDQVLREKIEGLLADLDADEFSVRTAAFKRLEELSVREDAKHLLAESVGRALIDSDISFEVRKQLERLERALPPTEPAPAPSADVETVDRLLVQLADDSYARRLGAESRLQWLLDTADAVGLIYERIKHYADDVHLTHEQARSLRQIYEKARAAWLEDKARKEAPPAHAEQIQTLVEQLTNASREKRFRLTGEPVALVELRDLLAIDANVAPIRDTLEARIAAGGLSDEVAGELGDVIALTKPAMIAEYWSRGRHENIQRLLVGVPSVTRNRGASHFDRVDDQTAHCVSGVNLSEGDYPVGVAIPHPNERHSFFHLINLPTPRRRMLYEYRVKENEAERYSALVARTLGRYLTRKLPLDERALSMIMQFGPREVSRFIGRYLTTVDDHAVAPPKTADVTPPTNAVIRREGPGVHGLLCSWLAAKGTQEAIPGLLVAVEENRLFAPSETSPCRFDRFAALAIAQRDPWPDVDRWLGEMLTRSELLVVGDEDGPELGATAAYLLLRRHGGKLDDFGLIACGDGYARRYGLQAYRHGTPKGGQSVAEWWKREQKQPESQALPAEPLKESDE